MVVLYLAPASDRYDREDDAWLAQERDLLDDLRGAAGGVHRVPAPGDGHKGAVEAVLIALASAGAFTSALECVRAWVSRDRTRRLEISYERDGRAEKLVITADRMGDADFDRFTDWAMRQLDGGS